MTLLLGVALLAPFLLRLLSGSLEPYPALLFPSGAGLLRVSDGSYSHRYTEVFARSQRSDEWERIENRALIAPLPAHFFIPIKHADFGLEERPHRVHFLNYFRRFKPVIQADFGKISADDIEETRAWLRARLSALGMKGDSFKVVERRIERSTKDGSVIATSIEGEKLYALH